MTLNFASRLNNAIMKKNLLLSVVLVVVFSCTRPNPSLEPTSGSTDVSGLSMKGITFRKYSDFVSVPLSGGYQFSSNGFLAFDDEATFANTIHGLNDTTLGAWDLVMNTNGILTTRQHYIDRANNGETQGGKLIESPYDDEFDAVINSDGVVQVDKWIFRIIENDTILLLMSKDSTQYLTQLLAGDTVVGAVWAVSKNDDVFDLLAEAQVDSALSYHSVRGYINKTNNPNFINQPLFWDAVKNFFTRIFGCQDNRARPYPDKDEAIIYANEDCRTECRLKYQQTGIYFSIIAKAKHWKLNNLGIWMPHNAVQLGYATSGVMIMRCYNPPSQARIDENKSDLNYNKSKIKRRIYGHGFSKSRALRELDVSAQFSHITNCEPGIKRFSRILRIRG